MRVTLDTNVLVSSFISKHGYPAEILDLVATFDEITLVISSEVLDEFTDVMNRKEVKARLGFTEADVAGFEKAIRGMAQVIEVKSRLKAVHEDPADDVIVNTALDGKTDYIVSGDKHLLKLGKFRGIKIVSPRTFMTIVARRIGDLILPTSDFG